MKLWKTFPVLALAALLPFSAAVAGPAAENLGACMVHSVDHHDRVVMDRFLFAALSEKPDLKPFVKLTADRRNRINKDMRALMVRLIRHDCRHAAAHAARVEGPYAARHAVMALAGEIGANLTDAPAVQRELNGLAHGEVADALDDVRHDALPPPPPPGPHGPGEPFPPPPFPF